jgi:hypothetical protein
MGGGFSGIPLYLLQDRINYFSSSGTGNSLFTVIVLGGIAGVIIAALVIGFIKNGVSAARADTIGGGSAAAPRKFNGFTLRRLAASYGLSRDQAKTLEFVFRNDGVTDPARVLANTALLDRHFKQAYRAIKQNAPDNNEAQARFVRLFSLRNAIEAAPGSGTPGTPVKVPTGAAKPPAPRKFKRAPAAINCAFAFVFEGETDARKRRPKLVVDPRRFTGTILDISAGGCSLRTAAAIRAGSLLKLEAGKPGILCLGQVVRINRAGAADSLTHIKFLKVPRRSFNTINALVFGYDG